MIRKATIAIGFLFFILYAGTLLAAMGGDVQITCEPDVRIWVDEVFKGVTTVDDNGLYVENLGPGIRKIKAAKSGYKIEERSVEVLRGKTIEVRFHFTTPAMKVEDLTYGGQTGYGTAGIGNFILRSAPLRATVYLDGREIGKTDTKVSNIGAGKHHLRFVFKKQTLEGEFFLRPNQTMKLKAHFKKGRIINELDQEYVNTLGMKFVYLPAGTIQVGSRGQRQEQIEGFFMQTTEVTQGQWKQVMDRNPSFFKDCGDDCPVENVSWNDAQEFIRRLNEREGTGKFRLSTPGEWEYACNSGRGSTFGYGNSERQLGDYAWYEGNARERTHPVAKKKPNQWGLYDMHGNVMEWCRDFYAAFEPVAKGGDFKDDPKFMSCQAQEIASVIHTRPTIGFRLVMTP